MASSGVPPAVQELLATETTFSEALHRMLEVYHKPLRDAQYKLTPLLHEREIDEIFGNVEDLLIIADELQRTLLKRISEATSAPSGKAPKVGDILTNFAGIFRLYERYIINYERGANRLGECKEKEKGFAAFLEKQGAIPGVLPLESYLIMPVQRILRYKLLLQEIIARTPKDSEDLGDLNTALKAVTERAVQCNEATRRRENMEALRRIQAKLQGVEIVGPERVLLCEGTLLRVRARSDPKDYLFFLFNDALIYAEPVGGFSGQGQYKMNRKFDIGGASSG
eukprot:CAMPEP_0180393088 /NCGR_PEP_ID=MMETSP0989-20121125/33552_1 /TAXON_ID=697907 /ORGANISM="non described non described, Strain CCMP2293" /LENGTH=281 /DNA_ID=CAMNT_0022394927 /DNA_START=73 /DNA_END=915 /DNA_ORIENTATION=+